MIVFMSQLIVFVLDIPCKHKNSFQNSSTILPSIINLIPIVCFCIVFFYTFTRKCTSKKNVEKENGILLHFNTHWVITRNNPKYFPKPFNCFYNLHGMHIWWFYHINFECIMVILYEALNIYRKRKRVVSTRCNFLT